MTTLGESFKAKPPVAEIVGKARIVAKNTFRYSTVDGREVTRLHLTDIVESLGNGHYRINSGGWKTVTTKDRINSALPGYSVYSAKGIWYVGRGGNCYGNGATDSISFYDGIVIPDAFDKLPAIKRAEKQGEAERKLKDRVKAFVNKTIPTKGPIPKPSTGDCWFCSMMDAEKPATHAGIGHTIHDTASRNNDHLLSHIQEGYMTGSLIVNAYRNAGVSEAGIAITLDDRYRRDNNEVRRRVIRYLNRRLGMSFR